MGAIAIPNLPNAEYHHRPELSRSAIKMFIESRDNFKLTHIDRAAPIEEPSDALMFGVALHTVALEGVEKTIVQIPPDKLTKAGAKNGNAWADFEAECAERGLIPLKENEYQTLMSMVRALQGHPRAKELLYGNDAVVEESIFWRDDDTHLELKCRPDVRRTIGYLNVILDLKGVADISPQGFSNSVAKYGYDIQNHLYPSGALAITQADYAMCFICVEKKSPFRVRCYQLSEEYAGVARAKTVDALEAIAECKMTGNWNEPGWDLVQTIPPPAWLKYTNQWEYQNGDSAAT